MHDKRTTDDKGGYPLAERVTGIKPSTLYSMVHHKQIPHYRIGKRLVVFSAEELQEWMAQRRVSTKGAK